MIDSLQDRVLLNCGTSMPGFGLGCLYAKEGSEVEHAVCYALDFGYRMIDTATFYNNEHGVGKGMRESRIPREDVFLTTKLWPTDFVQVEKALDSSLEKLGTEYVDLYLLHWPGTDTLLRLRAWEKILELREKGKIMACGVSNFLIPHLQELIDELGVVPATDQIEFHPWCQQKEIQRFCQEKDIKITAWGPLFHGHLSEEPLMRTIGEKYGKTAAQTTLRFDLQSGVLPIPKSVQEERIRSNADIFDFELSAEDMETIGALDGKKCFARNANTYNGVD